MYFLTFQTLLGSFVQRTSPNNLPLFSSPSFPLFCECKGTTFSFPSNTFINFFLFFFTFPAPHWKTMRYRGQNRRKNGNSADSQLKKRSLKGHIGTENIGKYHKIRTFCGKTERDWLAYRTRITPGNAEKNTGNGKKTEMPQPRTARTARDRTDDSGSFARRGAETRKEKAHLIN